MFVPTTVVLSSIVLQFLQIKHQVHLDPCPLQQLFVGPAREQTVYSVLLSACDPGDRVLMSRNLLPVYRAPLAKARARVTVTNNALGEILQLLAVFTDARLVLLALTASE